VTGQLGFRPPHCWIRHTHTASSTARNEWSARRWGS